MLAIVKFVSMFVALLLVLFSPVMALGTYRVQSGDTLTGIAAKLGSKIADLRALNSNLTNANQLRVGMLLNIPDVAVTNETEILEQEPRPTTYEIQEGDTFLLLAYRYNITVTQLINANPQTANMSSLWVGTTINLPPIDPSLNRDPVVPAAPITRPNPTNTPTPPARPTPAPVTRPNPVVVPVVPHTPTPPPITRPDPSPPVQRPTYESWLWPVPGYYRISSYFGWRRIWPRFHDGLDIPAPTGTPVKAPKSGTVIESGGDFRNGWGWTIRIRHAGGWITRYGHLSRLYVRRGQEVSRGDVIGRVGSTGNSTGSHLHFGMYLGGIARNPYRFYR